MVEPSESVSVVAAQGQVQRSSLSGITIVNVAIIDGTGTPAWRGSVRVEGDTIVAVGDVRPRDGDEIIDGHGLVLAPGFIDTHSHHDVGLAESPAAPAAITQGITTIIAGVDGAHPMPLRATMDSLERARPGLNVAYYAGHGTIRVAVMGEDFRRKATRAEVDSMSTLLKRELDAGALGLSTGLEYDPGIFSDRSEVLALAKVAGAAGTRYISHIRSEDRDYWEALDEIITIGREAKLPVQISHLKLAMRSLWGQADSVLRMLDRARASGVDITADLYPYAYWQSTLTVLFPNRDFTNRSEAEHILRDIVRPEGLLLGEYAPHPAYAGYTVAEIAQQRHEDPATTLMTLIAESQAMARKAGHVHAENGVVSGAIESVVATAMQEPDIVALLRWPESNICSDGMLDGPHPRGFGTFPRVLGRYVREQHVLRLEDAVRKMTSLSARHVGLRRRGTIAPGYYADLVLFDSTTIVDNATTSAPHVPATGIARVWVNGQTAWRDGTSTGVRAGLVIRRQHQ
jgi:N-acyl-D-amino-acid deacylase